jgi:hypothetical protein
MFLRYIQVSKCYKLGLEYPFHMFRFKQLLELQIKVSQPCSLSWCVTAMVELSSAIHSVTNGSNWRTWAVLTTYIANMHEYSNCKLNVYNSFISCTRKINYTALGILFFKSLLSGMRTWLLNFLRWMEMFFGSARHLITMVQAKSPLCLAKPYAMKMYGVVNV